MENRMQAKRMSLNPYTIVSLTTFILFGFLNLRVVVPRGIDYWRMDSEEILTSDGLGLSGSCLSIAHTHLMYT